MEKNGFRYFRLFTFGLLSSLISILPISGLRAQAANPPVVPMVVPPAQSVAAPSPVPNEAAPSSGPEVKSVIVKVSVPIVNGNTADAQKASEKEAFEKAVDSVLPNSLDPKFREEQIKTAAHHISGFQVLKEQQEGSTLTRTFQCDVVVPEILKPKADLLTAKTDAAPVTVPNQTSVMAPVQAGPAAPNATADSGMNFFEITWKPSETQVNPPDVFKHLATSLNVKVDSAKISRGSLVFGVPAKIPAEQAREEIASYLVSQGGGSSVKMIDPHLVQPPAPEAVIGNSEPRPGEVPVAPVVPAAPPVAPEAPAPLPAMPQQPSPNFAAPAPESPDVAPPPDFSDPTLQEKN